MLNPQGVPTWFFRVYLIFLLRGQTHIPMRILLEVLICYFWFYVYLGAFQWKKKKKKAFILKSIITFLFGLKCPQTLGINSYIIIVLNYFIKSCFNSLILAFLIVFRGWTEASIFHNSTCSRVCSFNWICFSCMG